jgi:hypothetical protein
MISKESIVFNPQDVKIVSVENYQVQQATDSQQKSELKNQLNDVHQEISNRTQKQLQDFVRQNPKIKQPVQDEAKKRQL